MNITISKLSYMVAVAMFTMSGTVAASGFALIEQNASGMGNAFAGGAAIAEDASTIFFNPAGMSRLEGGQAVLAIHAIKPSAQYSTDSAASGASRQTAGGNGGNAGGWAVVPNTYIAKEMNSRLHVGLGINAPFGLQTEYDSDWIGRFQAIKSKIQTVNLNPSVSYDVNEKVALGIGLNYQRIQGDLTSAVNYSAAAFSLGGAGALAAVGGPGVEGVSTITGTDYAWGYNLGVMFNPSPDTRVGIAYRSKIFYKLGGTVEFSNVPAALAANPLVANGDVSLQITMPDNFSISGVHQLNDKWEVMADATWTGWSVLKELKIDRTSGANLITVQENWDNTWRASVGANYHYDDQWMARTGVAYDQSPVPEAFRTARIPDNDRIWVSLGGQYKMSSVSTVDFGYAHLFVKSSTIADNQAAGGKGNLSGSYDNRVDILSAQYTYNF